LKAYGTLYKTYISVFQNWLYFPRKTEKVDYLPYLFAEFWPIYNLCLLSHRYSHAAPELLTIKDGGQQTEVVITFEL